MPVIVFSTVEEPATKAELLSGGTSDYMVKLPDRVELAARVRLHSEAYARLCERNAAFAALELANTDLARERERAERLLHSILPGAVAEWVRPPSEVDRSPFMAFTVILTARSIPPADCSDRT